jgi:hypothetical protein
MNKSKTSTPGPRADRPGKYEPVGPHQHGQYMSRLVRGAVLSRLGAS